MGHRRILVVDDDPSLLRLLSMRLAVSGYEPVTAESGQQALGSLAARRPDLIITDLRMDGMDGMALFESVHERHPTLPVIILTAHGSIPEAVTATQRGVFGFVTKPFDSQALIEQIEAALRVAGGAEQTGGDAEGAWREDIITCSPLMNDLLSRAKMVAASDASVLIRGDSGTGKELLARAIHKASPRAAKPFVAINCGAIPEQLLESELFGHRKGSFTGANDDRVGLFQAADGGTLFLDEIGDMPLALQVKLLRVLQDKQVRPVGASEAFTVDVRIVSATHRNLEQALVEKRFRDDLYYRLNVVYLELPPLHQRREDIALLATHLLEQLRRRYNRPAVSFAPEAIERLVKAPWPGNVRQLYNVVEHVVALSPTPVISDALVQKALRDAPEEILSFVDASRAFERTYLARLLQITRGNVTQAARFAKRNRTEFYRLLHRHQLDPGQFKGDKS